VKKTKEINKKIVKNLSNTTFKGQGTNGTKYEYLNFNSEYAIRVSTTALFDPIVSLALSQEKPCLNIGNNYDVQVQNKTNWPTNKLEI
jgi:hypothetical protein